MTHRTDDGMATAEYAVGTLGACTVALVVHELATDGYVVDRLTRIFVRALMWRPLLEGVPLPRIRLP
jgi:hypothetical protein